MRTLLTSPALGEIPPSSHAGLGLQQGEPDGTGVIGLCHLRWPLGTKASELVRKRRAEKGLGVVRKLFDLLSSLAEKLRTWQALLPQGQRLCLCLRKHISEFIDRKRFPPTWPRVVAP